MGKQKVKFLGGCTPSYPPSWIWARLIDLGPPSLHGRTSQLGAAIVAYDFARSTLVFMPAKSLAFGGREGLNHVSKDVKMPIAIADMAKASPLQRCI